MKEMAILIMNQWVVKYNSLYGMYVLQRLVLNRSDDKANLTTNKYKVGV